MLKGAIISPCQTYRYQLWRIWNDEKPKVLFICLNPSKADANKDDNTIRRITRFAYDWGFGGFYIGNLFAFRSTDPGNLKKAHNSGIDIIGPLNDAHLLTMRRKCIDVVFGWGTNGHLLGRNIQVQSMFPDATCLRITKEGFPEHPLFLKQDTLRIYFAKPYHEETVKCPECGLEQTAKVEHTLPWPSYIHECTGCKFIIMESEWHKIS